MAEQTGLITPLTLHVVTDALSQCGKWQRAGHDLGVSVNISARSLLDSASSMTCSTWSAPASSVRASHPRDHRVEHHVRHPSRTGPAAAARGLRHPPLGRRLRNGYSSLAYLQQLPVHELKVDKSFVFDIGYDGSSRAIVRSIVDLGHSLGLLVVAEGVEDEAAWDQLVRLGCDRAQATCSAGRIRRRPDPMAERTPRAASLTDRGAEPLPQRTSACGFTSR